jgi:metal-dependent HD superfamily phosphatase/phosphodiesterase
VVENEKEEDAGEDAGSVGTPVTLAALKEDAEVAAYLAEADRVLAVLGFTEHGAKHAAMVAERARAIISALGYKERRAELAAVAGHVTETLQVMTAIGNHDEGSGEPASVISAALTIADKSDVRRDRVRNPSMISFDIHDRVNYAAKRSGLRVDGEAKVITLKLEIDTSISQVMEYFETFLSRMIMCRRAARRLGCNFGLIINDVQML